MMSDAEPAETRDALSALPTVALRALVRVLDELVRPMPMHLAVHPDDEQSARAGIAEMSASGLGPPMHLSVSRAAAPGRLLVLGPSGTRPWCPACSTGAGS